MVIINLFLIILLFIRKSNEQTIFTPQYIMRNAYPFVLPYSDNENYYLITSRNGYKINKENGTIDGEFGLSLVYSKEAIFCCDNSNNSFIFDFQNLYSINPDHFILKNLSLNSYDVNYIGCTNFNNSIFIYGIKEDKIYYIKKSVDTNIYNSFETQFSSTHKISSKFIESINFICAIILNNNKIQINLLSYQNNKFDLLYSKNYEQNKYYNLALYDTTIVATTKIL